jgi:hypothetical protein
LDNEEQSNDSDDLSEDEEVEGWDKGEYTIENVTSTRTVIRGPPTGEELRKIKDAANLYLSNAFKLKVRYDCTT